MLTHEVYCWEKFHLLGFGSPWKRPVDCSEWVTDEGVTVMPKVRTQSKQIPAGSLNLV
jgi:hypothetical protein